MPKRLIQLIKGQRQTGFPLLLFVPTIQMAKELFLILKEYFPQEKMAYVSSVSEDRLSKVKEFREGHINVLLTTTILERGVTFPKVDVFVIQANHKVFRDNSLVQISGRVGRSKERPEGQLVFLHDGISRAMKQAVKEIRLMNQKGYEI
ncbi:helicase C-terminal domain protein [Streptococcus ictaluri 707-05]|uniref:Helicase C-terminal domain protein n=1 Tax=Streptococcus ictaluri 707-05 TaxID=764299 RepID=G5K4I1_9STRE|nr:helicase C-terminal domain protein [Streptococcus ictaluri 707-05]